MKVKKYTAQNLPEAMKLVRADLGSGAVILNTREVQVGGFFGFFTKKNVEIFAGLDQDKRKLFSDEVGFFGMDEGLTAPRWCLTRSAVAYPLQAFNSLRSPTSHGRSIVQLPQSSSVPVAYLTSSF